MTHCETDLYEPLRNYLMANGYTVDAEVQGCDIVARKDDELIVVELKLRINLELLIQATDRQRISSSVYVAVPRPASGRRSAKARGIIRLLRMLEIGLIYVSLDSASSKVSNPLKTVQVVFHPLPYVRRILADRKRAVITEATARQFQANVGGSVRTKLITAYREQAIFIAVALELHGPMSPKQLRKLGADAKKTYGILSGNRYGWFTRVGYGIFTLTSLGTEALQKYSEIAVAFRGILHPEDLSMPHVRL